MILELHGYRGHKLWSVSLDGMEPVTVKAPAESTALIRAAIYYGIDWLKQDQRDRFQIWRYKND